MTQARKSLADFRHQSDNLFEKIFDYLGTGTKMEANEKAPVIKAIIERGLLEAHNDAVREAADALRARAGNSGFWRTLENAAAAIDELEQ